MITLLKQEKIKQNKHGAAKCNFATGNFNQNEKYIKFTTYFKSHIPKPQCPE